MKEYPLPIWPNDRTEMSLQSRQHLKGFLMHLSLKVPPIHLDVPIHIILSHFSFMGKFIEIYKIYTEALFVSEVLYSVFQKYLNCTIYNFL